MRYLKKFNTQAEYNSEEAKLSIPNASYIVENNTIARKTDEDIIEIEYLKGALGAYIDTGIPGSNNLKIEIRYSVTAHEQYGAVLGNYVDENSNAWRIILQSSSNNHGFINVNTKAGSSAQLTNGGTKNMYMTVVMSKTSITINGTTNTVPTTSGTSNITNIALFSKSTTFSPQGTIGTKIMYCKIWDGTVLVRDFIPVRVGTVGYMYDKVNNKIFGSIGSGNFVLGPDIDTTSHGKNLITNGFATYGTNYNFTQFTFDSSDMPSGTCGSFMYSGKNTRYTDEYMYIQPGAVLNLKYWVKNSTNCTNYDFIDQYDIDKNQITYDKWHWITGTTTYLTQDLNNGDTIVHLANVAPIKASTYSTKGFIIWDYKDSRGYQYPTETYSRRVYTGLWTDNSTDINETNNTITLKAPWNKGPVSAGTYLSHYQAGGTFHYGNAGYRTTPDTWTEKSAIFNTKATNNLCKGTYYIRLGWLINYSNTANNVFKAAGLKLTQKKHL